MNEFHTLSFAAYKMCKKYKQTKNLTKSEAAAGMSERETQVQIPSTFCFSLVAEWYSIPVMVLTGPGFRCVFSPEKFLGEHRTRKHVGRLCPHKHGVISSLHDLSSM